MAEELRYRALRAYADRIERVQMAPIAEGPPARSSGIVELKIRRRLAWVEL